MHNDFRFQKQDGVPGNQKQQSKTTNSKQQVKTTNSKQQIQNNKFKTTRLVSDGGHATHQQLQKATFAPATTTVQRGTVLCRICFGTVAEHKPPCSIETARTGT